MRSTSSISQLNSGSLLVGADGRIAEVNASFLQLSGWAEQDLVGEPLVDVLVSDPVAMFSVGGPFRSLPAWLERPDGHRMAVTVRPFPFGLVNQDEATWVVVSRTLSASRDANGVGRRERPSRQA